MMITTLMLSAIALLPGEDKSYLITDHIVQETDCVDRYVGAQHLTLCDLSRAFKRIENDIRASVPLGWQGYGTRSGGKVTIPPGRWWLSEPVRFCRQMTISGAGGGDWGAPTVIYTPHGVSGFRVAFYYECVAEGLGEGAQGTLLEDFALIEATGTKTPTTAVAPPCGIQLEARSEVRNVWIRGFAQGLRISADHNRNPPTNANGWRLHNVVISNTEHAGLYVDGGDANVGMALAPNATAGCGRASAWASRLGPCANFVISDFLGSTIVAAHASGSNDSETGANFPNYLFEGSSQRGVCVGCYSESDIVKPKLAQHTMWIGSTAMDGVGGYRQAGLLASGLQLINDKDPANKVTLYLGSAATMGGAALELVPSGGALSYPLRLKAEPSTKSWRLDVANLNSAVAMRIGGAIDAQGSYGGVTFPKPIYLGSPAIPIQVVSSTTALAQPCVVGTESILRIPQAGKDGRAVCVVGGTWEARE